MDEAPPTSPASSCATGVLSYRLSGANSSCGARALKRWSRRHTCFWVVISLNRVLRNDGFLLTIAIASRPL